MANWAIVIGIDKYWSPSACLKGAVRDALQMRDWLLDVKGGNVPNRNLFFLLTPSQDNTVPSELQYLNATQEKIIEVLSRVVQQSGGKGERLFFHYSGHGMMKRENLSEEQVLIPSDFTDLLTIRSMSLRSILEFFDSTQFQEQFFFIDACRNIPWEGGFRIGGMPWERVRDPSLPAPQQFVFYSTSPGVRSAEIRDAGNERGAFTEALLDGLRGKGKAKAWDIASEEYLVRVDRLFKYLINEVSKRQLMDDTARRLIQIPRLGGERGAVGDIDPILARFPAETFSQESLTVFLEPTILASKADVAVEREGITIARQSQITQLPLNFALPQKEYRVRVSGPNCKPDRLLVELYNPQEVTVKLATQETSQPAEPGPIPTAERSPVTSAPSEPLIQVTVSRGLEAARRPAHLILETSDSLLPLELVDNTGKVLMVGRGKLVNWEMQPGYYRARLQTPEGQTEEKLFELLPGKTEKLFLEAPKPPDTRLTREIIKTSVFKIQPDNTLVLSKEGGIEPLGSAKISTILTFAGSVVNIKRADDTQASQLRNMGLKAFREMVPSGTDCGVQVLFGVDSGTREEALAYLSGMKLRLWPMEQPVPESFDHPATLTMIDGLAEFAWATKPGAHWLSIELPGQKPIVFALAVIPHHLALLVLHIDADGKALIFQYLPELGEAKYFAPWMLTRMEMVQRFYLNGRFDHAYKNAMDLLYVKWMDPFAACLGSYIVLKLGKGADLWKGIGNLTHYFGELSDSHVIQAGYEASLGDNDAAILAFQKALDRGIPIFADGLARLYDGIQKYHIDHPRAAVVTELFQNRVGGLLWSAWTPNEFFPGKQLNK